MHKRHFLASAATLALCAALPAWAQAPAVTPAAVARHYAALVSAGYEDALVAARQMQETITAFLASPTGDTLDAARKAWLAAREVYGQTEAFRFYGGPIDDDKGPEGRINAWPMDEAYVDYVAGKPRAGIVNNPKVKLSKAGLARLNERGGEENVATGWHAVEFLLWGQDMSDSGPGERPATDYVPGKGPNAERRRQYLTLVTEMLVEDLQSVARAWAPGARNYRARFEAGGLESVRKMIVGIGSLSRGELAGERMEVAMNTQDQEDEHSCFSDNTHRDIVNNALGIQNVWLGSYRRTDGTVLEGPSLQALVATKDPALAERATQAIAASLAAAAAIQAPFDREIVGPKDAPGRQRVQKTINSLTQQSKDLVAAAAALGIKRLAIE
jgi:putative iron-regulated protein